jgi:hypothetical protein
MHPVAIKASTVVLAVIASMMGTAAVVTYDAGLVRISVVEKHPGGDHVRFFVPAVLVPVAMNFVPQKELHKHAREARQWLPLMKVVSEELERCPDATLVEVKSPDEHVKIQKSGDTIIIDVDDPSDTVHVSFPARVVTSVVQKLEAGNPPV